MANQSDLLVRLLVNDKGLKKGLDGAKKDMAAFNKAGTKALDGMSSALGINIGKIGDLTSAFRGMGAQIQQAGGTGSKALGGLITASAGLAGALAGIGIAAVVAGFKELNSEAERFSKTVEGARYGAGVNAWNDTFAQYLSDQSGSGQWWQGEKDKSKAFWAAIKGKFFGGSENMPEARARANEAKRLATEIFDIGRSQKKNEIGIADLDARIAEARLTAQDATVSLVERQKAFATAQDLIRQKYDILLPLQEALAKKMTRLNELASSSVEAEDAAIAAEAKVSQLKRDQANEERTLLRLQKQLAAGSGKGTSINRQNILPGVGSTLSGMVSIPALEVTPLSNSLDLDSWKQGLEDRLEAYRKWCDEIQARTDELNEGLNQAIVYGISNSIQVLMNQLTGLEDFNAGAIFQALLEPLADTVVKAGEMIMAQGIAVEAFNKSLASLTGIPAIVAGATLIAVGSAAKSGLQALANGGGASTSEAYSYAGSGGTSGYGVTATELTIHVDGRIKGGDIIISGQKTLNSWNR